LGADESSTSLRSDCKKLGPVALLSATALPAEVVPLASLPVLEDSPPWSRRSARASGLLVRGRFNFRSGCAGSGSTGDAVGDFLFRRFGLGASWISRALS